MNIRDLSNPLAVEQVDFRVQSINKGGYATILAYKDARVDQQRLDDVVGPLGWKREHVNGNHNCIVSIWCGDKNLWVSKEDTGTESNAEAAKGLASDSFKRACFNWGIGRELYDYPKISIKLDQNEYTIDGNRVKATWDLKIRDWVWIGEFDDKGLKHLKAMDGGRTRFDYWSAGTLLLSQEALIKSALNNDAESCQEIWRELSTQEQEGIWSKLDSAIRKSIKELLKAIV